GPQLSSTRSCWMSQNYADVAGANATIAPLGVANGSECIEGPSSLLVHDRPELAPGVFLVGKMQGVGFRDQQWLVQRGDSFVQMTELLYHIAEGANGERNLEEIAASVTRATEWMVDAGDVARLITSKLIPLGIIAGSHPEK